MKAVRDAFRFIYYNLVKNQSDLKADARFTKEEMAETARRYAESIGWVCDDNLIQRQPHLMYERGKMVWNISFFPLKDGLPVRGGHLCILIDDKTGEVIKKVIGTR